MEEHWARGKREAVARTKFPNTNGMREANALSRSGLYMIYQMYTAAHGSWPQAIAPKTNGGSHKLTSPASRSTDSPGAMWQAGTWKAEETAS